MSDFHLGFWLSNLVVPNDPQLVMINTPKATWELHQHPNYQQSKATLGNMAAETYALEATIAYTGSRSAAGDALFDELLPLCLGASYITGLTVAPHRGLPHSDVLFVQVGPHFPRVRAMGTGHPIVTSATEFVAVLERFVANWNGPGSTEKARLLTHHWLDALAFWSLEDLVLSTGTILEVIAATAKTVGAGTGAPLSNFNERLAYAASRFGLPSLPSDFRKMRNDLVHEGVLSGTNFPGRDAIACGAAAAEALDWIDAYIFAALNLGTPPIRRFGTQGLQGANSFSL